MRTVAVVALAAVFFGGCGNTPVTVEAEVEAVEWARVLGGWTSRVHYAFEWEGDTLMLRSESGRGYLA